jgi:hypothetical protein
LAKRGRLLTLEEDTFSKGLEMFILTLRRSQKRQRNSEEGSKEGSEHESELDDGAVEDSKLDPEYKD